MTHDFTQSLQRVELCDIWILPDAATTIGLAAMHVAQEMDIPIESVSKCLTGELWHDMQDGTLYVVMPLPDIDADSIVEIPAGAWGFRVTDEKTQ